MLIAIIVLGVINALLVFYLVRKQSMPKGDEQSSLMLKQDITTLTDSVTQLKDGLQKQLNDRLDKSSAQMMRQFQTSTDIIKTLPANWRSSKKPISKSAILPAS